MIFRPHLPALIGAQVKPVALIDGGAASEQSQGVRGAAVILQGTEQRIDRRRRRARLVRLASEASGGRGEDASQVESAGSKCAIDIGASSLVARVTSYQGISDVARAGFRANSADALARDAIRRKTPSVAASAAIAHVAAQGAAGHSHGALIEDASGACPARAARAAYAGAIIPRASVANISREGAVRDRKGAVHVIEDRAAQTLTALPPWTLDRVLERRTTLAAAGAVRGKCASDKVERMSVENGSAAPPPSFMTGKGIAVSPGGAVVGEDAIGQGQEGLDINRAANTRSLRALVSKTIQKGQI